MKEIISNQLCTGCECCKTICPKSAITMVEDYEGFKYPQIDSKKCIDCGLCKIHCPVLNFEIDKANISTQISTYAYRSHNLKRYDCSSGGVFYDLAITWIKNGGLVVGSRFDEKFKVYFEIIDDTSKIDPLIGSKYLQSDVGNTYFKIDQLLKKEKKILFFGMTCQIEALLSITGINENLYCIDLICMGIPSPGVWNKYLSTYFDYQVIKRINFKNKDLGWRKIGFCIENNDGTKFLEPAYDNKYMECMFKGYTIRPSCFNCVYKCENKKSDLTIADCWGCEEYIPTLDDNMGLSMIISHSRKGENLVNLLKDSGDIKSFNYNYVLKYNSNYYKCTTMKGNRTLFYKVINNYPKLAFDIFGLNPEKSILSKILLKLHI